MMRSLSRATALLPAVIGALVLALPASGIAAEPVPSEAPTVPTTTVPSPEAPVPATPSETPTTTSTAPAEEAPQIQGQLSQSPSAGSSSHRPAHHPAAGRGVEAEAEAEGKAGSEQVRGKHRAAKPSTLTPSLPLALQGSIAGVPSFFIESFQVPPFLLPIFQAAGAAYAIPWQVLAAINEVETDYGRDLSVSSAGAEGWMQFLPASWAQYGVDANGDGFEDPYNPADAIFAAARYLRAAGGDSNIRAAIFSYNHSQAYVSSVILRAQLLGGTPSELLGAITGLTEARFPIHAAAHFSDGFPSVKEANGHLRTLIGTAIYATAGSPVIATQDGEIVELGDSPTLGHFVGLKDAYGNTYVYAELGDVSSVYPVLQPHVDSTVSSKIERAGAPREPAPSTPASAGVQARSPISESGTVSGLALGAAAGLESTPPPATTPPAPATPASPSTPANVAPQVKAFTEGATEVYLHPLSRGSQVIAGTVLGHVGSGAQSAAEPSSPHIVFQIRPAGLDAPLIDPKPILDGWVSLENSSVFHAKGENPFLATSPTVGQVLLESKQQLQPQVLHDKGIRLGRCGRQDVQEGRVDKRVLAMLEYLSVSGLRPTVGGLACAPATPAAQAANTGAGSGAVAVTITAINGLPVAGHQTAGSASDTAVRKLLMLQGLSRPKRIVSTMSYPGSVGALTSAKAADAIRVAYAAPKSALARVAGLYASALAPAQWTKLIARLGEIPDPSVSRKPSTAAIPDPPAPSSERTSGGNH
jgi:murein DD-endopeptidase MepM/ murein hydrolase activator NlpD